MHLSSTVSAHLAPAKSQNLGPMVAIYRDRPLLWRDLFALFVPALLAVLLPLLYGFMRNLYARANYGLLAARAWSRPWYALALIAAVPLLLLALRRVRRAHRRVALHKNGLRIEWTGGQQHVFLWEQLSGLSCSTIENCFLGFQLGTRYQMTFFPRAGAALQIDDHLQNLPDLMARVKAKLHPRWLPQMRAALRRGETLSFGVVSVHQGWIRLRGRSIPWAQVSRLSVVRGHLVVESGLMRRVKIPVYKIPNIELLIQLLQEGVIS